MNPRRNVALVFGGQSAEHGVSCLTAANVLGAIDQDRYEIIGVGITRNGRWTRVPLETIRDYRIRDGVAPEVSEHGPDHVWMSGAEGCEIAVRLGDQLTDIVGVDVVFPLLHGPFGEDGTIQGLFEMLGVRYVGSGVCASAVGMDKHFMRVMFSSAGLPVGPYTFFDSIEWRDDRAGVLEKIGALGYPLYVKPARGGSSIGISRVSDPADLDAAIAEALRFDPKLVVEQGVVGAREVECAVLEAPDEPGGCLASLVGEIRVASADGFYDFETKYMSDDRAQLDIPAVVDDETSARVREAAIAAFRAVGAEGLARVDMFVLPDGEILLNEINTMPGFTNISMYPALWNASGVAYDELVDRLIRLGLERPLGLR